MVIKLIEGKKINTDDFNPGTSVAVISTDKDYVLSKKDFNKFKKNYFDIKYKETEKIEGTPTYKGVVRGKARIILGSNDFSKFKKNDILVCSMTDPNFVPLMKKALAFVFVMDMGVFYAIPLLLVERWRSSV